MINKDMMNEIKEVTKLIVNGEYDKLEQIRKIEAHKALVFKDAINSYLSKDERLTMPPDKLFEPKGFCENDMCVCELVTAKGESDKFSIYFDLWVNDKKRIDFTLGCMASIDKIGRTNVIIYEIRLDTDFIELSSLHG